MQPSMFVELKDVYGKFHLIQTSHISIVKPLSQGGIRIILLNGDSAEFEESYENFAALLHAGGYAVAGHNESTLVDATKGVASSDA